MRSASAAAGALEPRSLAVRFVLDVMVLRSNLFTVRLCRACMPRVYDGAFREPGNHIYPGAKFKVDS
jgi:hypothetical protein